MSSDSKVAMVTGGNRGIGLALVRSLCKTFSGVVYLTSRNEDRGQRAIKDLMSEGLKPRYHQLDLDSSESIARFAKYVNEKHGGIDVVIANGAISYDKNNPVPVGQQAEDFIRVNNKGNAALYKALEPLLRQDARYVIVSSGFGQLKFLSEHLQHKFNTDNMSVEQLNAVLDEYVSSAKDGSFKEKGWPDWPNVITKIGLVALVRILVRELKDNPRRLLVNAACPGWTVTDATKSYLDETGKFGDIQAKQPDEAAGDVVWLTTLPPGSVEPQGKLVQYRTIIPFEA